MIHESSLPQLHIPKTNILDYLFPKDEEPYDQPIWYDAADSSSSSLSPKQMLQWIKCIMVGLQRLGLKRGDVCMIHTPNHILVPAAYLGIVGGGMCFSAANPLYTVDDIVHQLKNTGAKCLLSHPALLDAGLKAAEKASLPKDRVFLFDWNEAKPRNGVEDFRSMIGSAADADQFRWTEFSEEESLKTVATINFSSGTTGLPKGVAISHHSLIANVEQTMAVRWPRLNFAKGERPQGERWVGFLPLYHAYGQLYAMLMAVKARVPIHIMQQFDYEGYLRTIQDNKVTVLQVAPPILIMLLKRPETSKYDLSSVESILCGGAPLSKELQMGVARKLNCEIKQGWGMTEVTCGSTFQTEGKPDGSVGRLVSNTRMKLVDDQGNAVGFDTPGEICIQAPNVMLRYWRNEAATRDTLTDDGWLKTGDVGVINKEGNIWIVDRKKELIKVNALQVAPAELEGLLLQHESVADAAVAGMNAHDEEFPRAYVMLKPEAGGKLDPKDIQEWFKARVAKHKALTGGVKFVQEIPRLQSGKIQRATIREWIKRDAPEFAKSLRPPKL